jgi:hypothetical protein
MVSYGLYTMGFLLFVMSLKKQTLLYQARLPLLSARPGAHPD